jgi:hypothetical protein
MLSPWIAIATGMMYIASASCGSLTPVYMDFTPALLLDAHKSNVTVRSSYSQTRRQHSLQALDDQQTGRMEVHWQFATVDRPCDGGCGTIPCVCPVPQDTIFFEW